MINSAGTPLDREHGARAHTAKPGVWLVYVRLYNRLTGEWSDELLCEEESEAAAVMLAVALDEQALNVPGVAEILEREEGLVGESARRGT